MIHKKVTDHWDENAQNWIEAAEMGLDIWRDCLNTQAFLNILPNIQEAYGLDIGCGEGDNTRLIAERCKNLTAIDISEKFIAHNRQKDNPSNLTFKCMNAVDLAFENNCFDFVVATMSFMEMAEMDKVLSEINRVLKPNGFLQFSIVHPCFNEYIGKWLEDDKGERTGFLVEKYFIETEGSIHEWKHFYSPESAQPFRTPRFLKPLSKWLNLLIKNNFSFEEIYEPFADESSIKEHPVLSSTLIAAHSLIIRVKKI